MSACTNEQIGRDQGPNIRLYKWADQDGSNGQIRQIQGPHLCLYKWTDQVGPGPTCRPEQLGRSGGSRAKMSACTNGQIRLVQGSHVCQYKRAEQGSSRAHLSACTNRHNRAGPGPTFLPVQMGRSDGSRAHLSACTNGQISWVQGPHVCLYKSAHQVGLGPTCLPLQMGPYVSNVSLVARRDYPPPPSPSTPPMPSVLVWPGPWPGADVIPMRSLPNLKLKINWLRILSDSVRSEGI